MFFIYKETIHVGGHKQHSELKIVERCCLFTCRGVISKCLRWVISNIKAVLQLQVPSKKLSNLKQLANVFDFLKFKWTFFVISLSI